MGGADPERICLLFLLFVPLCELECSFVGNSILLCRSRVCDKPTPSSDSRARAMCGNFHARWHRCWLPRICVCVCSRSIRTYIDGFLLLLFGFVAETTRTRPHLHKRRPPGRTCRAEQWRRWQLRTRCKSSQPETSSGSNGSGRGYVGGGRGWIGRLISPRPTNVAMLIWQTFWWITTTLPTGFLRGSASYQLIFFPIIIFP